ncbi:MAG TPA: hypothetical protein QF821_01910 [Candidatus Thalassarchaeaceae archaeon]|nr:hypothetical protein [Candidatus Thalassarchaeaceae archaeon]
MGTSPRSRWSNRDDTSYQESKPGVRTRKRALLHKWTKPNADSSAPILIVGQLTSLVSLVMIHAGTESSSSETLEGTSVWGLGESTLLVTVVFGLISFLFLLRVSISHKAPKRRRRIARVWLLAAILATQLI